MAGIVAGDLDAAERERVEDAVRRAEAGTAGEIVVVVEQAAGAYRSLNLVMLWMLAFAVPWPLIWGTQLPARTIFLTQLVVALVLALLSSARPGWRVALTPRFIKRGKAHEAACREFMLRGLTRTKARSGVLLYVALAERYAEVVADSGINADETGNDWRDVVNPLTDALRDNRLADGLVAAIDNIGNILARTLPPSDHVDELPNKVIILR
jgi:putative membrane protein